MESTRLMDMLFSDSTPDVKKDAVANKITEALQTGSSQLNDGVQDLTLTKEGDDLVKIQDNKSGESTLARPNPDGGHDLVAESDVNQANKTFSNMNYMEPEMYGDYGYDQERLFTEDEVIDQISEVRYFSELESGIDRLFSEIDAFEEGEYSFSDIESAYNDLEVLYSELEALGELGNDVSDAMDRTVAYSDYLTKLYESEVFFSDVAEDLSDAADEVQNDMATLVNNPTDKNKEIVKDKVDKLQEAAKDFSEYMDTSDLMDELICYSEIVDETFTFSDVEDLRNDVTDLHDVVTNPDSEDNLSAEDLSHRVKALSEEARAYADMAEEQGHDVSDIHEKLNDIDDQLDHIENSIQDSQDHEDDSDDRSFSDTYVDSFLNSPIN